VKTEKFIETSVIDSDRPVVPRHARRAGVVALVLTDSASWAE
jgi:hypothetical protein